MPFISGESGDKLFTINSSSQTPQDNRPLSKLRECVLHLSLRAFGFSYVLFAVQRITGSPIQVLET